MIDRLPNVSSDRPTAFYQWQRAMKRAGFSLMEILVALSIIMVLATLAFGALSRIRDQAASSKCVGQLRTIGNSFFLYAAENNGRLPAAFLGTGDPGWNVYMAPYLDLPANSSIGQTALRCPTKSSFSTNSMYAVNYVNVIGIDPGQSSAWLTKGVKRIGSVDSRAFLLTDGQGGYVYPPDIWGLVKDQDGDGVNDSNPSWPYNGLDFRHNKKANFFLLNGSIVPLTSAQWATNENNVWGLPQD